MKLVLQKNLLELLFPHITYKRKKNGSGFTHTQTHTHTHTQTEIQNW